MANAPGRCSARFCKFRDPCQQLRRFIKRMSAQTRKISGKHSTDPNTINIPPSQSLERDEQPHKSKNATAIQSLSCEHRHIETVIKSLHDAVAALNARQRLNVQKLQTVVEFLRVYADQRHHQREEALLFPALVKRGVPAQGCPIGGLNNELEKGRALVFALDENITAYEQRPSGADSAVQKTLQAIIDLYRKHLWMEDAMVFPMAEKIITETENKELKEKFADLDRKIGPAVIVRLEQFAGSLSFQAGTADFGYGCS